MRLFLVLLTLLGVTVCPPLSAADAVDRPKIEIFMPSPCLACIDWGAYLAENGFRVS